MVQKQLAKIPPLKIPLKNIKISRVVLISGILTFIYCIEFCLGIRTIFYTFKLWSDPIDKLQGSQVSWTLCVACLLTATITAFTVNVLSAVWEQKQLQEKKKEKSAIRFAFHIAVGGMLWRYIHLWCIDSKEFQKKDAILLTMTKFFFTQTFTIPMVIVHVSVMDHLDELIYDVCSILCISVNLILTCTMFSWCSNEVEDLKKWDYETVNLIPLIFQTAPKVAVDSSLKVSKDSNEKDGASKLDKKDLNPNEFENTIIRTIVFFQSFGFSLGRLLALGILLKLAGIYAVSIMFLQLLLSVIYLKFQSPFLVSDSLPKWRQLTRLAFLSYMLIFEWHLNRDTKTGYDFSFSMKHSILYYCLATLESVFYLVTWAVTTHLSEKSELSNISKQNNKFYRIILVIGSMALVFSLTIHVLLLFWKSRKMSMFFSSVRRHYENTKLRLSKSGCRNEVDETEVKTSKRTHVDISSPIPIKKRDDESSNQGNELEKYNSYRDLREPLDEEIEIYFRKCDYQNKSDNTKERNSQVTISEETKSTHKQSVLESVHNPSVEMNDANDYILENSEVMVNPAVITPSVFNSVQHAKSENVADESEKESKSKFALFSDNVSEQWGKFSSISRKFTGTVKDQFKKKKDQIQNLKSSVSPDSKKSETLTKSSSDSKAVKSDDKNPKETIEVTEGYFVGDDRCYQIESSQIIQGAESKRIRFSEETLSQLQSFGSEAEDEIMTTESDNFNHKEGDSPCPCYICKTFGDGRFRRRRSSSVPPFDRKRKEVEITRGNESSLPRYMSTPNISQNFCEKENKDKKRFTSPTILRKSIFNLSALSLDDRVEHYV